MKGQVQSKDEGTEDTLWNRGTLMRAGLGFNYWPLDHGRVFALRAAFMVGLPRLGWLLPPPEMPPEEGKPFGTRPV